MGILLSGLPPQDTICNGDTRLCDRSYGNITFMGAHDSFAYSTNASNLAADQNVDPIAQLDFGIRMLQGQVHNKTGTLELCHTNCTYYDGGPLSEYLTDLYNWMIENPLEVVTLLLTNPDGLDVKQYWLPVYEASGLDALVYNPPNKDNGRANWPTLRTMVNGGTRLVVFMDYSSNTGEVPWILPEFDNIWEPPFDSLDATFPCSVNRVNGSPAGKMYLLNHFLDLSANIPDVGLATWSDRSAAGTTNSASSILNDANGCAPLGGGNWPSFVLMDLVDQGDWLTAHQVLNGL